jgi:hypothetical protein
MHDEVSHPTGSDPARLELRHEDFEETDWELIDLAGNHLVVELHDIVFHHHDGTGWATWPPIREDAVQGVAVVRDMLEQAAAAVKEARRLLASAERRARLAAVRRRRTEGGEPR